MRIKEVSLYNYRSFANQGETIVEFPDIKHPISIIGHNNAGKSNLIDAILLLLGKKSAYGNNFTKDDFFNQHTDEEIVLQGKITDPTKLTFCDIYRNFHTVDTIKLTISYENGYCETSHILCDTNGKQLYITETIKKKKEQEYTSAEEQILTERRNGGLVYFSKIKNKIPLYFINPVALESELSPRKNSLLGDIMKNVKNTFETKMFPIDYPRVAWRGKTRKDIFNKIRFSRILNTIYIKFR